MWTMKIVLENANFGKMFAENRVVLEKRCKMSIYYKKSASI